MYLTVTKKPLYMDLSVTVMHLNFFLRTEYYRSKYSNDGR